MARRCIITGKGVQAGNNVSHSKRRTRRRFLPNIQTSALFSEALGTAVHLKMSTSGLRTIEHNGGIDAFLLGTADAKLSTEARRLKRQIAKAQASRASANA